MHEAVSGPVCLGTGSRSTGSRLQAPGLLREGRSSFVERSFSTRARPDLRVTKTTGVRGRDALWRVKFIELLMGRYATLARWSGRSI